MTSIFSKSLCDYLSLPTDPRACTV